MAEAADHAASPDSGFASSAGGFPARARQTGVPSVFFSDVLPAITDPAELVVSLYIFYVLGRRMHGRRYLVDAELQAEAPLMQALARFDGGAAPALKRGLTAAVARGTLLRAVRRTEGREVEVYAVHVPGAAEMLTGLGATVAASVDAILPADAAPPLPNIFILYEENIGVVSPLLAEQLGRAESEYPWPWIEAAFREAVALNRRNWRYIERILERWRTEGPDLEAIRRSVAGSGRRSLAGKYWRLVRR